MKNVLNYFVRKAFGFKSTATAEDKTLFGHLLRIRQNIQGVYDWLYDRLSAEHLPKRMPMTEAVVDPNGNMGTEPLRLRPVLQNSDTLLAHLRLLDGRKISNGYQDGTPADDGLPDGVSLARLLCDSTLQPTALIDDNVGWTFANNSIFSIFTKVPTFRLNCVDFAISSQYGYNYGQGFLRSNKVVKVLDLPYFEGFIGASSTAPAYYCYYAASCEALEELLMPSLWRFNGENQTNDQFNIANCPVLRKVVFGSISQASQINYYFSKCPNLLHLEFGEGTKASLNLAGWSPTLDSANLSLFLDNFLHFIAERVAEGNYTLTLSAAVYAALEQQEGQTILALLNTKGWTVASA